MPALATNVSRDTQGLTLLGAQPLASGEKPFLGSGLTVDASGNVAIAAAGLPFAGFAAEQIEARFAPTAAGGAAVAGGANVTVERGLFFATVPLSGVTAAMVAARRSVFMTDDATFTVDPTGATFVGVLAGIPASGFALVLCQTSIAQRPLFLGVKTLAATGAQTILASDADKLLLIANTAALTLTLPAAADWAGRTIAIKKTGGGTFTVTLDGAGSETVDGAATNAAMTADNKGLILASDGTKVVILAAI